MEKKKRARIIKRKYAREQEKKACHTRGKKKWLSRHCSLVFGRCQFAPLMRRNLIHLVGWWYPRHGVCVPPQLVTGRYLGRNTM